MTNENELIRRGDAISELSKHAKGTTTLGGQNYQSMTLEVAIDAIALIPAVAASQPPDLTTEISTIEAVYNNMPDILGLPDAYQPRNIAANLKVFRAAKLAASQPADPVVKSDSCQRVTVKPLVWFEVERGTNGYGKWTAQGYTVRKIEGLFLLDFAGEGKSTWRFITSDEAKAAAQADYEARILAAINTQPDPRDEVIARLVEASEALQQDMMERARCGMDGIYGTEYRIVNAGRTAWGDFCSAIDNAKGVKLAD